MEGVVVDTNVFVAAGFNANSASARLLEGLREGRFRLIWDRPTRGETEMILRRISRLDWRIAADLFRPEGEFTGPVDPGAFTAIADPDDRKFAPLVTSDKLVLAQGGRSGIEIATPRDFLARQREQGRVGDLP